MKKILLFPLILLASISWGQDTTELSMEAGYANQVYYSLENGVQETVPLNSWDLAFGTGSYGSTISFNGAYGSELYVYENGTTSSWSTADTTGLHAQSALYNTDTSWSTTAFNKTSTSGYDLGWGIYSQVTHVVTGDSIYFIKFPDNSVKKFYIDRLQSRVYYLVHANLDGTDSATVEIKKDDFTGKNHGYFSFESNQTIDLEPSSEDWDLLFTKYLADLPDYGAYGVSGVLINNGVKVATVTDGTPLQDLVEDTSKYIPSSLMNAIGYQWKAYSFASGTFAVHDSTSFIITDKNEKAWNVEFVSFTGSTTGELNLRSIPQSEITGIFNTANSSNKMSLFPNPVQSGQMIHLETDVTNNSNFKIYNQAGEIIFISNEISAIEKKSSELSPGIYMVEQQTLNSRNTQKLIIY